MFSYFCAFVYSMYGILRNHKNFYISNPIIYYSVFFNAASFAFSI